MQLFKPALFLSMLSVALATFSCDKPYDGYKYGNCIGDQGTPDWGNNAPCNNHTPCKAPYRTPCHINPSGVDADCRNHR